VPAVRGRSGNEIYDQRVPCSLRIQSKRERTRNRQRTKNPNQTADHKPSSPITTGFDSVIVHIVGIKVIRKEVLFSCMVVVEFDRESKERWSGVRCSEVIELNENSVCGEDLQVVRTRNCCKW